MTVAVGVNGGAALIVAPLSTGRYRFDPTYIGLRWKEGASYSGVDERYRTAFIGRFVRSTKPMAFPMATTKNGFIILLTNPLVGRGSR